MAVDTSEWIGSTLCDGRYRVLRKLGDGGMAHVYVARDERLERDVVIKVPRTNLISDASFAGRFTREVRSLAKLAHPHVVPLIDVGQHDGAPFAVMHYLTGGSLRDRQPRGPGGEALPAPAASLAAWLPAVAEALDFVHRNKFVHRDIKPENILFDEDGQVFLGDLGIIKALAEPQDPSQRTVLTGAGMVLGTPQYMAPELIMGEAVDGRADQYALAVTAYEALSGRPPFVGTSAPAIFIQQTTKPPPSLRELAPGVPDRLVAAIERALAKTPAERFATCADFARAALGERPIAAAPPAVGGDKLPSTVRETPPAAKGFSTLLEQRDGQQPTPSNLRNPTQPANVPTPGTWNAASTTTSSGSSTRRRLALGAIGGLSTLAIAVAAFFLISRGQTPSLSLQAVNSVTVRLGTKEKVRVEFERKNVAGEVRCWLDDLPTGVTAEAIVVAAGQNVGDIEIAAAATAEARSATATLKAKADGVETSVPVPIAVAAQPSLRFAPVAPQTIKAGESAAVLLYVERLHCEGQIRLEVKDLPPGVLWHRSLLDSPAIVGEQSTYRLELKATADAPDARGKKATVVGTLGEAKGQVSIAMNVLAAPAKPEEVKLPDPGTKKPTVPDTPKPMPEAPKPESPKPESPKPESPKPESPKPETPKPTTPPPPPELTIARIADVMLRPGERKTVVAQIGRKNATGPTKVALSGLPAPGLGYSPAPLPSMPEDKSSLSFEVFADPTAADSRHSVALTASIGDLRTTTFFDVTVVRPPTVPMPPKPLPIPIPPPVAKEDVLWQTNDMLTNADMLDRVRLNSRSKSFPLPFKAGKMYVIDLTSDAFDPYLRIEDGRGVEVAADDDSGIGLNARIIFFPQTSGIHHLVVTTYKGGNTGAFKLTVR